MSKFTFGSYNIRPTPEHKWIFKSIVILIIVLNFSKFRFKANEVKNLIKYTLSEELKSKQYDERETQVFAKYLSDLLLQKLKGNVVVTIEPFEQAYFPY